MAQRGTDLEHEIDQHVAARLRHRRREIGMSQTDVAERVGISFQMMGRFENGVNRIMAGRLFLFAKILGVPLAYFFEGLGETLPERVEDSRAALDVARNITALPPDLQLEIARLVRTLASTSNVTLPARTASAA